MFKFLDNVLASKRSLDIVASKFNHCSSVCPLSTGSLLAWYSGSGECRDDQSVHLIFIRKGVSEIVRIGDKTGNPILWSTNDGHAILLYSKFEDTRTIYRIVDRWKHCSLWIQHVEYHNGIQLLGDPIKVAEPADHLLARCNPIAFDGRLLIPLYDEVNAEGVIAEFRKDSIEFIGRIGEYMIQPTLWVEGDKICSLSRNFKSQKINAQYSQSLDGGKTWSNPISTKILNNNNSLHVLNFDGLNYLIWNDTGGKHRSNLSIGEIISEDKTISVNKIEMIGQYGSYPSMAIANERLVFSFTASRKIQYHEWNRKALRDRRRDSSR